MTGNDLIASALKLLGVLQSGENPTPAENQDAFNTLNQMLDSWSVNRLRIFTVQRQVTPNLTPGTQAYTLGPNGPAPNLSTVRPPKIQRIGILSFANPAQPLELPMEYLTTEQWAAIPVKAIQSTIPLRVWDDQGFPYRTLNVWCIPNGGQTVAMALYVWVVLSQFADLVTDYEFPPGYLRAVRYNLAVELGPEFLDGGSAPPGVMATAREALAEIENINAPDVDLRCDPGIVSPDKQIYNWITDGPVSRG